MKALCTVVPRLRAPLALALVFALLAIAGVARAGNYASIVMNAATGDEMYGISEDEPRYPASLTKMMTLYLTFDALDKGQLGLADRMRVSAHAAAQSPSKLGLEPGDEIAVEKAILALVTKSANDAAVVLAEHLAGTESAFAERMTARAHALGMTNSYFRNASGLPDPGQVTTARDMARLAHALLHRFPHYYPYFSTASFEYGGVVHRNHNRMLGTYDGVDGIKTGFINASGFNLVASARRDGHRLIGVVFGSRSSAERSRTMAALLDGGFEALDTGTFVETAAMRAPVAVASAGGTPLKQRSASSPGVIGKAKVKTVAVKTASAKNVSSGKKTTKTVAAAKPKGRSTAGTTVILGKTKLTSSPRPASKTVASKSSAKVAAQKSGKASSKSAVSANAGNQTPQAWQIVAKQRPSSKGSDKQEALKSCQRSSAKTISCRGVRPSDDNG